VAETVVASHRGSGLGHKIRHDDHDELWATKNTRITKSSLASFLRGLRGQIFVVFVPFVAKPSWPSSLKITAGLKTRRYLRVLRGRQIFVVFVA
jgi:hypothetical protein